MDQTNRSICLTPGIRSPVRILIPNRSLEAPMAKQITVQLSAGPKQEIHSPLLSAEQFEKDYAQIVAAQKKGGFELLTLPWLSVRGGAILAVHVSEEAAESAPPAVASWE
jgi:hypothetical protein